MKLRGNKWDSMEINKIWVNISIKKCCLEVFTAEFSHFFGSKQICINFFVKNPIFHDQKKKLFPKISPFQQLFLGKGQINIPCTSHQKLKQMSNMLYEIDENDSPSDSSWFGDDFAKRLAHSFFIAGASTLVCATLHCYFICVWIQFGNFYGKK